MATATATPPRTATTKTSIFPLAAFFVLAYALSWLILVPAGFGLLPDSAGILAWLAPFGPAVAAFVVTALTGGHRDDRGLARGRRPPHAPDLPAQLPPHTSAQFKRRATGQNSPEIMAWPTKKVSVPGAGEHPQHEAGERDGQAADHE